MIKTPESSSVIRFQDCDPFGHLNNSKYIDYMFNAREDHLVNVYDLNIFKIAQVDKLGWVVAQNEIIYMKPAFVMEKVLISTQLIEYTDRYVKAEMIMFDHHKTHIKSVLWAKFFHFDLKANKAVVHNEAYMDLFAQLVQPLQESKVEQRAFALSAEMKTGLNKEKVI